MAQSPLEHILRARFPQIQDWSPGAAGIDLDQNGSISEAESFQDLRDRDSDGYIDAAQWQRYWIRNLPEMTRLGSSLFTSNPTLFRNRASLRDNNPLHEFMASQLAFYSPREIDSVYQLIRELVNQLRRRVRPGMRPEEKMGALFQILRGLNFQAEISEDFIQAMLQRKFDCDMMSYLISFVSFEMQWPVSFVLVPNHAFVRWEEAGRSFNFDYAMFRSLDPRLAIPIPDDFYRHFFMIAPEAEQNGLFLRSIPLNQMQAFSYDDMLVTCTRHLLPGYTGNECWDMLQRGMEVYRSSASMIHLRYLRGNNEERFALNPNELGAFLDRILSHSAVVHRERNEENLRIAREGLDNLDAMIRILQPHWNEGRYAFEYGEGANAQEIEVRYFWERSRMLPNYYGFPSFVNLLELKATYLEYLGEASQARELRQRTRDIRRLFQQIEERRYRLTPALDLNTSQSPHPLTPDLELDPSLLPVTPTRRSIFDLSPQPLSR